MRLRHSLFGYGLFITLMMVLVGCHARPAPIKDTGPVMVTVSRPFLDKVTVAADLTGVTDAVETVQVRARVSGYITAVKFTEGDIVEGGKTLLFEIDPVTYDANLKRAEAKNGVSQAKLDLAIANEARTEFTYKKGASTKQELDTDTAQRKVAAAELEVTKNEIVTAKQDLDWSRVIAPISGRVDKAFLTKGNVATGGTTQGTVLTNIVNVIPKIYAYFDVDDQSVLYYKEMVRAGKIQERTSVYKPPIEMLIRIKDAKGVEVERTFMGEIDFITNTYNSSTGTRQLRGVFANPDGQLDGGLFVRGRVMMGAPIDGILIPDSAVVTEQTNKLVYVVNAENKVEARTVTLGPIFRGLRVVGSGLKAEDRVVIRGTQRIQSGQLVDPQEGKIEPIGK